MSQRRIRDPKSNKDNWRELLIIELREEGKEIRDYKSTLSTVLHFLG